MSDQPPWGPWKPLDQPQYPPQPKQEQWSAENWRLLVITMAGGLAANLGTVLIVGLRLAYLHERHSRGISSAGLVGSAAVLSALFAAVFVPVMFWSRSERAKRKRLLVSRVVSSFTVRVSGTMEPRLG